MTSLLVVRQCRFAENLRQAQQADTFLGLQGEKPAGHCSAEVTDGGPVVFVISGAQPHDTIEQLQFGAQTRSMARYTGGERPVG